MRLPIVCLALLLVPALGVASVGGAAVIEGVSFEPRLESDGITLDLRGYGLLHYLVFIKAYVGALYLPAAVDSARVLEDVPRRLEIAYFHAITAEDFAQATADKMADNVTPEAFRSLEPRLRQLNALYRDVRPGDRYALTYLPGQGTTLALNGTPLGTVPGADFAAALFAIWLGADPIDRGFKAALLGRP